MTSVTAALASADWLSTADRLSLLIKRFAIAEEKVAQQLGWPLDQLRAYLSPEARRQQAASDIADTAVDKLLMRYRISLARQALVSAPTVPAALVDACSRRSSLPAAFAHPVVDRRSIIHAHPTTEQQRAESEHMTVAATATALGSGRRKRKRKVLAQELAVSAPSAALKEAPRPPVSPLRPPSAELMCPIRVDVDVDGVRYQDTFLMNASSPGCSPELMAAQIAIDERFPDSVKDALTESIRRQLMVFCAGATDAVDATADRLYPIYLDVMIEGLSLRDQFEWDITNSFASAQSFASTLCADLNLSPAFESAAVFSIWEQVVAYRTALNCRQWIGIDLSRAARKNSSRPSPTLGEGFIDAMPPHEPNNQVEDEIVRQGPETALWQPVVSELSREERQYLAAKLGSSRAATSRKRHVSSRAANGHKAPKRHAHHRVVPKELKGPRPINPFIMYCQVQKDIFANSRPRRSASETRKIFGDMWRKCTDEEKEYYAQLTEAENEKRRREHVLDLRDRAIAEWEEDEARRKGLLPSSLLDPSADYFRGLLLENYMSERHDVDANREAAAAEVEDEEGEDAEHDE